MDFLQLPRWTLLLLRDRIGSYPATEAGLIQKHSDPVQNLDELFCGGPSDNFF